MSTQRRLVCFLIGTLLLTGCSKQSTSDINKTASGAETQRPGASSNTAEKPIGTVELHAKVETFYLGSRSNHLEANIRGVWLFLDGFLLASSPTSMERRPCDLKVREPNVSVGEHKVKLWLFDCWGDFEFHTLERSVVVNEGKTTDCELLLTVGTSLPPNDWVLCSARSEHAGGSAADYWVLSANDINAAAKNTPALWETFRARNDWTAFAKAGAWLNFGDPKMRSIWVELPKELGGPREIDRDQLSHLRDYLLNEFDRSLPRLRIGPVAANIRLDGWQEHLDRINAARTECRQSLDTYLSKLANRLTDTPSGR